MGKHSIFKAFVKHEGSRVDSIDPWFSFERRKLDIALKTERTHLILAIE